MHFFSLLKHKKWITYALFVWPHSRKNKLNLSMAHLVMCSFCKDSQVGCRNIPSVLVHMMHLMAHCMTPRPNWDAVLIFLYKLRKKD